MVPLEELAIALIEIINDKKIWVFDKEESLLEVEKSLTSLLSGFDSSTEEMVQTLHHTRDKQVHVSLFNVWFVCILYLETISLKMALESTWSTL